MRDDLVDCCNLEPIQTNTSKPTQRMQLHFPFQRFGHENLRHALLKPRTSACPINEVHMHELVYLCLYAYVYVEMYA